MSRRRGLWRPGSRASHFCSRPSRGYDVFRFFYACEYDPFLQTIPEEYDFEIEVYASSCGTMRRESSVVFGEARASRGETSVEFLPPTVQSGYNIFWTSQSDLGTLEFGDVVSEIEHKPILFQELIDNLTGNVPEVTMRSFEISVGLGFGQVKSRPTPTSSWTEALRRSCNSQTISTQPQ